MPSATWVLFTPGAWTIRKPSGIFTVEASRIDTCAEAGRDLGCRVPRTRQPTLGANARAPPGAQVRETLNKVSLSTGIESRFPPDEMDEQTTEESGDDEWF